MNSITRFILGVISSLLLAAGFTRAADRLDPMNNALRNVTQTGTLGMAVSCTVPCTVPCEIVSQTT